MQKNKEKEIQLKYYHETISPILPAVGDIRLNYTYSPADKNRNNSKPKLVFHILCCIRLDDHHAIYEYLNESDNGKTKQIAIPLEMITNYGFNNTNSMIRCLMNRKLEETIKNSKKFENSIVSSNEDLVEYSKDLEETINLYRLALKEASRINHMLLERK